MSEILHSPTFKTEKKKKHDYSVRAGGGMEPLGLSGAEVMATLFPGITFAELKVKLPHTSELH